MTGYSKLTAYGGSLPSRLSDGCNDDKDQKAMAMTNSRMILSMRFAGGR